MSSSDMSGLRQTSSGKLTVANEESTEESIKYKDSQVIYCGPYENT